MTTKDNKTEGEGRKTFVVAGVGDIGMSYAKKLSKYGEVYAISRNPKEFDFDCIHISADLLVNKDVRRVFDQIPKTRDLTYLHLVGKFAFEDANHPIKDTDGDGLDDDINNTNIETFRNVKPTLIKFLDQNAGSRLKVVGIGSTMDIYGIPFWNSFTQAKNQLRKEFRELYGRHETYGRVGTLIVNVSTVDGEQLKTERPFISKEYVLRPEEVVEKSLSYVLDERRDSIEMTLLKPNPHFAEKDFLSHEKVLRRWESDMEGQDSQIEGMRSSNDLTQSNEIQLKGGEEE